eukprot:snap_masked-scaffold_45-processed-gene-1.81-mRNA-1 protein AED:0.26 eAED:0.56 QI:0/0/0/1/1/1/2/0/207
MNETFLSIQEDCEQGCELICDSSDSGGCKYGLSFLYGLPIVNGPNKLCCVFDEDNETEFFIRELMDSESCSNIPFEEETSFPTEKPTVYDITSYPTGYPTIYPTRFPTNYPTDYPTNIITEQPSQSPTQELTLLYPTEFPTSQSPTQEPTLLYPTEFPTSYISEENVWNIKNNNTYEKGVDKEVILGMFGITICIGFYIWKRTNTRN